MTTEARLHELEQLALELLIHDFAAARRAKEPFICIEAQLLRDYFKKRGVNGLDVDNNGKLIRRRIPLNKIIYGDLLTSYL